MSPGNGKSIRSVQRKIAALNAETSKNHIGHLFLGGIAVTCHRLLNDARTVFAITHATFAAGHQHGSANMPQHQSTLGILGKKDSFAEFLGQVYLYSLTRDNVLTPEAKERINTELEEYKRHPLEAEEVPETIIFEERAYTAALALAYGQAEKKESFSLDDIADYPEYAEHFAKGCSKSLSCVDVCPMHIPTLASIAKMNRKA